MASPLSGLSSNFDITALVSSLMQAERAPIRALTTKSAQFQAEISAFGITKGTLSSLQTASHALGDAMTSIPATVTSSATAVAGATAQAGTTPGVYGLTVQSLAQAHRIYSSTFSETSAIVGSGAIAIDRGSFDGTTFTANGSMPTVTITIPANATLTGIRDAVNSANTGITASIINDGTGYRLVLGANDAGAANGMRIRVTDDDANNTDAAGLSQLAYDPEAPASSGKNMIQARAGANASFTIDGLPMTRPSNSVSDAVTGITFSLAGTGTTNVAVARDTGAMRSALDTLVKAYNSALGTMKSQTSFNSASQSGGPLNGESSVRNIMAQLRQSVVREVGTEGDTFRTLSALGVTLKSDGTLSVNDAKYSAAIAADPVAASRTMGQFASSLTSTLGTALGSDAPISMRTDGLQSSIKRNADQQTRIEARLVAVEARYRTQFTALDNLMARMNSTSSFLTAQLNNSKQ